MAEPEDPNMSPGQARFRKKMDRKQAEQANQQPMYGQPNQAQSSENESEPQAILEKNNCTVFLPGNVKEALDWDYLAGYGNVKRDIEDTVLLALTNQDVYDKITQATRMKDESNRPKCVLFEGPPGCGKTTSAKIISQ